MLERLLHHLSARLPCRLIDGEQGEPYLERYYLAGLFGWHVYLHRFVDSDPDRGLHDHPWDRAYSLVLTGGYDEIRGLDLRPNQAQARTITRFVAPGRINRLTGATFHRAVLKDQRPAWTLFMHGPRRKGWGFLQNGTYRPMAQDGAEFRHRDWWKSAPSGLELRRRRS